MPMAHFGKNARGENLYRVVFAPTVRQLIFGTNKYGEEGAHNRPRHRELGKVWILERWRSAWEMTQMTPAEYEKWGPRDPQSGLLLHPYPYEGVYELAHVFDHEGQIHGVHLIIEMIEKGAKRSFGEIQRNNRELDSKAEKQDAEQRFLRCREVEPLYGARAANFAGKPKTVNHKSARLVKSANELGLPTSRGKFVARRGPTVDAGIRS